MRQYTRREFERILVSNGFHHNRTNGSHIIYTNNQGNHISFPRSIKNVIARRLIKENNLII